MSPEHSSGHRQSSKRSRPENKYTVTAAGSGHCVGVFGFFYFFKNTLTWGAWLALSEERGAPDLQGVSWSPTLGVEITKKTKKCN